MRAEGKDNHTIGYAIYEVKALPWVLYTNVCRPLPPSVTTLSHKCQHYHFRAGSPAFLALSHFLLKMSCFFLRISHLSCNVSICIILCVLSVWN